mmetsp:Transcript_20837/g.51680  ORF Transcript_20837/g.51680 Transcript_20837/m.51680 type:complete len:92 (-) Transcript_20837:1218-1493(-)
MCVVTNGRGDEGRTAPSLGPRQNRHGSRKQRRRRRQMVGRSQEILARKSKKEKHDYGSTSNSVGRDAMDNNISAFLLPMMANLLRPLTDSM